MSTNGLDVDFVSFVRYSTSTHSTNTDQRLVELKIVGRTANALYLEAPRDGAMAPPGNWFLFALNEGKPSVAATILVAIGPATTETIPDDAKAGAVIVKKNSASQMTVGGVVALFLGLFVL
jgi:hypothetical protein